MGKNEVEVVIITFYLSLDKRFLTKEGVIEVFTHTKDSCKGEKADFLKMIWRAELGHRPQGS